jgi:hypothetical protein
MIKAVAVVAIVLGIAITAKGQSKVDAVTYEAFGAVGDGVTDDMPAIIKAHEHANQNGLPVRSKPGATYHLGSKALTAFISTHTDWGTSKFVIDDSKGVENSSHSIFKVQSLLNPISLKIDKLKRGQDRLDIKPPTDCLVYVENNNKKLFIRKGLNQNSGSPQKEVFILKTDGSIIGQIEWDYDQITKITAQPIDTETLIIKGGDFTNIANQMNSEVSSGYWDRNISISRSNTVVDGVIHHVTGEKDTGLPYSGFLSANRCANIKFQNCVVDGRKTYSKIGSANKPVPMGSYGYHGNLVVNFHLLNCRMGNDINDRSRWGVVASNFMKNFIVEKCVLSRVDVHMGVSGFYTIKDSTLGHAGLNAIGRGQLVVENTTIHNENFISFRSDYGSTWEGDVIVRNCRWLPPKKNPTMFSMQNDGTHDFGYACFMPKTIKIENLTVEEPKGSGDVFLLDDAIGKSKGEKAFPYSLTEAIQIKNFKSNSGKPPKISKNPEMAKAIKLELAPTP